MSPPMATSITSLSYAVLSASLKKEPAKSDANIFISPLSIFYALTLALNGSGPGSSTHKELLSLLCPDTSSPLTSAYLSHFKSFFTLSSSTTAAQLKEEQGLVEELGKLSTLLNGDSPADQDCTVKIANGLFSMGVDLDPSYCKRMEQQLGATAQKVPDIDAVNAWVSSKTNGEIPSLLSPGPPVDAVLANALYFKGLWVNAFKPNLTRARVFHAPGGDRQVLMMTAVYENENKLQIVTAKGKYQAVMLPYRGLHYAAMIVLPEEGVPLSTALQAMRSGGVDVSVSHPSSTVLILPKFRAESSSELQELLQGLGVKAAFSAHADFARAGAGLAISKVVHKAVVDVDEQGTVASAATAVAMNRALIPQDPPRELVIDRPFIFSIQHVASGTPVFYGVVQAPPSAPQQ